MTCRSTSLFILPVLVAAWYGGVGPGLLATCLSVALGTYFFILPNYPLMHLSSVTRISLFIINGSIATFLVHSLNKIALQAQQHAQDLRASDARLRELVESLHERERQYYFALQSAHAGAWERDLRTGKITFADETYDIYGIDPGAPITVECWEGCLHPEDRQQQQQVTEVTLKDRRDVIEGEFRIVHPKRGIRWIKARGCIIYSADGAPLRMLGIVMDSTVEKESQEAKQQLMLERSLATHIEAERFRIGQELHDGIRQQLIGIQMLSSTMHKRLLKQGDASANTMGEFARMVGDGNAEVRRLISGLVPLRVEGQSLVPTLKRVAENIEQWYDLTCQVLHEPGIMLHESDKATHLYYIAKEAMTNAGKHSRASCVTVALERRGSEVILTVRDDGVGLPEDFEQRGGLGIRSLKDRAALIGAQLLIENGETAGTVLTCCVQDGP
jgi:PAS domain S-box-containing protein